MGSAHLRRAFGQLDLTKQDRANLIPAVLGFMLNGVQTVDIPNRPGYVYARVRSNLNEMVQVFNDKVSPVYDLPVLLVRDPNNPTRYKVEGRDVGRYENWGSSSSYLPKHGNQHSFNPTGDGGGDITWIYSQQITPWLVSPSGTFGSGGVLIHGQSHYANSKWSYWGGTGTSSVLVYKPTGTYARMVLVSFDNYGNPLLTPGSTQFDTSYTGSASILSYLPAPTTNSIPLAGILLVSGTSSILWDNIYDLRPFFPFAITGSSAPVVTALDDLSDVVLNSTTSGSYLRYNGANWINATGTSSSAVDGLEKLSMIRHWDVSGGVWIYYANSNAGLTAAIAALGQYDTLYLPIGYFEGSFVLPAGVTVIGTTMFGNLSTGWNSEIDNYTGNPVFIFGGANITLENLSIYTMYNGAGGHSAIEAFDNAGYMKNCYVSSFNSSGPSWALHCSGSSNAVKMDDCLMQSTSTNVYAAPYNIKPTGNFSVINYPIAGKIQLITDTLRVGGLSDYLNVSPTGTLSFAGAGDLVLPFVTGTFSIPPTDAELDTKFGTPAARGKGFLTTVNVSGTAHYLISSDGASWFYTSMTKAL